ncbi:MAG: aminodeoxychorismate/anthranilate synthase component II [Bacteroidales bacterium]
MKILVIDNYDSFTYNLVHILEKQGAQVTVLRPDALAHSVDMRLYKGVVISPGPGLPADYPVLFRLLDTLPSTLPILGVCLGLQVLAVHEGASLQNLQAPLHGRSVEVMKQAASPLFQGIAQHFKTGRYHSWVIDPETLPVCFEVTAIDEQGTIQGVRHRSLPREGVQFHPESVLTEHGEKMLKNWVNSLVPAGDRNNI